MDSWTAGSTIRLTATIRDALTNELVDPFEVTCRLLSPQTSTVIELDATRSSAGYYWAQYIPREHGVWTYRFEGVGTADSANEGAFFIRESSVPAPTP